MSLTGTVEFSVSNRTASSRWPLLMAPFVGIVYYLVLLLAFLDAMGNVVDASDVALPGLSWGHHWLFHILAECVSVSFGTFVAAGITRERAVTGGLLGGLGIALLLLARSAIVFFMVYQGEAELVDPLYQHLISAAAAITAPIIGFHIGKPTQEIGVARESGFAGISRLHFLWLWVIVFYYAKSIIGPLLKYVLAYYLGYDGKHIAALDTSVITGIIYFVFCVVPTVSYCIPLFIGLGLMSGVIGHTSSSERQIGRRIWVMFGAIVLIFGWFIAATIQYIILVGLSWLIG
jgi:hypothetical protein